jgi:hypothetical protein
MISLDEKAINSVDYFKSFIFFITLLYIIIEICILSNFAFNYDFYYNYGKNINKICKLKYYEYETPRYQIVSNYDNLIINIDKYNNPILYFIYIIFGILLSLIFIYYILIIKNDYNILNIFKYVLVIILLITIPLLVLTNKTNIIALIISIFLLILSLSFNSKNFDRFNIYTIFILFIAYILIIDKCKIAYKKYVDNNKLNFYEKYSSEDFYSPIANFMSFDINVAKTFKLKVDYLFIFLIVLLLLALIPKTKEYIDARFNKFLYYMMIITCLVIFLISKTINLNTEINKTMIYEPLKIYKSNINDLNKAFYFIINKDNIEITNKSVCRNIANLILLVLYSKIFTSRINIFDAITDRTDNDSYVNKYNINIDPEFTYLSQCNHDNVFDYTKDKSYDINYYLNNKNEDSNIFYHSVDNKCTNVNIDILKLVINNINTQINSDSKITIKDYINKAVSEYLNIFNDANNNVMKIPELKENVNLPDNENFPEYLTELINNIVVEYNKFETNVKAQAKKHLELICACEGSDFYDIETNLNSLGNTTDINNIDKNSTKESIKNSLIKSIVKEFNDCFNNINVLLSNVSDTRRKNTLSNFIINNYNNIHIDDKYNRNSLKVIKVNDEELKKNINDNVIKRLINIDNNLNLVITKMNKFFDTIDNGKWDNYTDLTKDNYLKILNKDIDIFYNLIIDNIDKDLLLVKNIIIEYTKNYDVNIKECYSKNIQDTLLIIDKKYEFIKSILSNDLDEEIKDKFVQLYNEYINTNANTIIPDIKELCKIKNNKNIIVSTEYNNNSTMFVYIIFIQYICTLLLLK